MLLLKKSQYIYIYIYILRYIYIYIYICIYIYIFIEIFSIIAYLGDSSGLADHKNDICFINDT